MARTIEFRVAGVPVPQGSMVALTSRSTGMAMLKASNEKNLRAWRKEVAWVASLAGKGELLEGPLVVNMVFYLPRPKSVSVKSRPHPHKKPDLSKLVRAVEDSCTGTVWVDDAQVVNMLAAKCYAGEDVLPGVGVLVSPMKPRN